MGVTLLFDPRHRVLLARFEGTVTAETVQAMSTAARRFAEREGQCSAIADFTNVDHFEVEPEFLRNFAQNPPVMAEHKRVLVAPADAIFGSMRMFEMHQSSNDPGLSVVRSLDRAYETLGLIEPEFGPVTGP